MRTQPKTAAAVHPNIGVEMAYRKRLQSLVKEMAASYEYWLKAAYREAPPKMAEVVAEDESPAKRMSSRINELGRRWQARFDGMALSIANQFARTMFDTSDRAFKSSMQRAGWTVNPKMTPAMRDALAASIEENVGLIKSIPAKYHEQVEGVVMRSYTAGRDLATMTKEIKALYPRAKDRAVLIARDQSNKANATVNRARQLQNGITEAIWLHSHGGKEPRKSHVAASGKRYDIAKGCKIDGEYIQPGEKINCRCVGRPVLPF